MRSSMPVQFDGTAATGWIPANSSMRSVPWDCREAGLTLPYRDQCKSYFALASFRCSSEHFADLRPKPLCLVCAELTVAIDCAAQTGTVPREHCSLPVS